MDVEDPVAGQVQPSVPPKSEAWENVGGARGARGRKSSDIELLDQIASR